MQTIIRNIVAIDPGASGGIAVESQFNKAIAFPMPGTEGDLINLLKPYAYAEFYLENLVKHMGGGIPASAMAVYASNWGFIKGAIQGMGCPLHIVGPQKWQKFLGLGNKRRDQSKTEWKNKLKAEAQRLYPHLGVTLKTADALLLLSYAKAQPTMSAPAEGVKIVKGEM